MRHCALAALLAVLLSSSRDSEAQGPIIDMHMHARRGPMMRDGQVAPRPCMPMPCTEAPTRSTAPGDPLRHTLAAMKRHNIVLGFLSGGLEEVFTWVDAAPNQFIAAPLFTNLMNADTARLRKEYVAGRLRGMGEIGTQYTGIAPNDSRLDPFYAMAVEFDVPVLVHAAGIGGPAERFRIAHGHPQLLEEVLTRHPRLRPYLENAGFPFLEETIALMYRYPGVYADLSTITWIIPRPAFNRYLAALMDAGLGKRLMFGSDQSNWPETIDLAVDAIQSAPFLTPEQKRDIFYNNAARFLRLDGGARPGER